MQITKTALSYQLERLEASGLIRPTKTGVFFKRKDIWCFASWMEAATAAQLASIRSRMQQKDHQ